MNYFIHEGASPLGPFSYEELNVRGLEAKTPVWRDGMAEWVEAGQLPELNAMFGTSPPPYHSGIASDQARQNLVYESRTEKSGFVIGKFLGIGGILFVIILIGLYVVHSRSINRYGKTTGLDIPYAADPEHSHPEQYLNTGGTYKTNFWGTKENINGTITNTATHTNYKDVRVKIEFLSQTKSVISTQEYIVYQYVPYGSTRSFSLSLAKAAATESVSLGVVSATYY